MQSQLAAFLSFYALPTLLLNPCIRDESVGQRYSQLTTPASMRQMVKFATLKGAGYQVDEASMVKRRWVKRKQTNTIG